MAKGHVAPLHAIVRPAPRVRSVLAILHPGLTGLIPLEGLIEDENAIHTFAKLLERSIEESQTKDGRVDLRDVAARVLKVMKENQK